MICEEGSYFERTRNHFATNSSEASRVSGKTRLPITALAPSAFILMFSAGLQPLLARVANEPTFEPALVQNVH